MTDASDRLLVGNGLKAAYVSNVVDGKWTYADIFETTKLSQITDEINVVGYLIHVGPSTSLPSAEVFPGRFQMTLAERKDDSVNGPYYSGSSGQDIVIDYADEGELWGHIGALTPPLFVKWLVKGRKLDRAMTPLEVASFVRWIQKAVTTADRNTNMEVYVTPILALNLNMQDIRQILGFRV